MPKQPEQILENQLVAQLQKLQYEKVIIKDENALTANLKTQLEKHNNITFSDKEFERVLNILSKGKYAGTKGILFGVGWHCFNTYKYLSSAMA